MRDSNPPRRIKSGALPDELTAREHKCARWAARPELRRVAVSDASHPYAPARGGHPQRAETIAQRKPSVSKGSSEGISPAATSKRCSIRVSLTRGRPWGSPRACSWRSISDQPS